MRETISLRSKFLKVFPEALITNFIDYVHIFNVMNAKKAFFILWTMYYNPQVSSERFVQHFPCYNQDSLDELQQILNTNPTLITSIRNELRYQYSRIDDSFPSNLYSIQDVDCQNYINKMSEELNDPILITAIVLKCDAAIHLLAQFQKERIIKLFSLNSKNNLFGAIRSLGFNYSEANYLLPYVEYIHQLFLLMMNENQKDDDLPFTF